MANPNISCKSISSNCSSENGTEPAYEIIDHVVPRLWGPLILLGVLGNGFVVYVMLR